MADQEQTFAIAQQGSYTFMISPVPQQGSYTFMQSPVPQQGSYTFIRSLVPKPLPKPTIHHLLLLDYNALTLKLQLCAQ